MTDAGHERSPKVVTKQVEVHKTSNSSFSHPTLLIPFLSKACCNGGISEGSAYQPKAMLRCRYQSQIRALGRDPSIHIPMLDAPDPALQGSSDGLRGVGVGTHVGPRIGRLLDQRPSLLHRELETGTARGQPPARQQHRRLQFSYRKSNK